MELTLIKFLKGKKMKYIILTIGLFFFSVVNADGHLQSEKDVLVLVDKYFEARNNEDYDQNKYLQSSSGKGLIKAVLLMYIIQKLFSFQMM